MLGTLSGSYILWLLSMETFYGISITHSLCPKHTACQEKNGWRGGGYRKPNLKKQEEAETSQFMEDLHLVFQPKLFPFISLDFFKLANTLDPGENTWGKTKKNENKAMHISVTCTIALTGSGCLSGWMNCGLFLVLSIWSRGLLSSSISGHLGLLVTVLFLCCHTIQNESCRSHHPRKILKMRGYVERVPRDPFQKRVSVYLGLPTLRT